jgi:hypothetical protein
MEDGPPARKAEKAHPKALHPPSGVLHGPPRTKILHHGLGQRCPYKLGYVYIRLATEEHERLPIEQCVETCESEINST